MNSEVGQIWIQRGSVESNRALRECQLDLQNARFVSSDFEPHMVQAAQIAFLIFWSVVWPPFDIVPRVKEW